MTQRLDLEMKNSYLRLDRQIMNLGGFYEKGRIYSYKAKQLRCSKI